MDSDAVAKQYDDDYATCHETFASLRISGGDAHPSSISERLTLAPTSMRERGKATSGRNVWILSTQGSVQSRDSRRHIDHLIKLLEGREEGVKELRHDGWKMEVIVFWTSRSGHDGPFLNPSTMRRLAERELSLWSDVYLDTETEGLE